MAQTMAPVLGANISGESPVQQTSWLEPVANLVGGFAKSLGSNQNTGTQQRQQRELQAYDFVRQENKRATAVEQTQGDWQTAQRIRSNAISVVAPYVDTGSSQFKSFLTAETGEDPEKFTKTEDQQVAEALEKDPLYNGFYVSTDPSLPPDQRKSKALADVSRIQANNAAISAAQTHWDADGQNAYIDNIRLGFSRANNLLTSGLQPGASAIQAVQEGRIGWNQIKSTLVRPANVKQEQWAPIQAEMERVDKFFDLADQMYGAPGIKQQTDAALATAAQSLGSLVLNKAENVGEAMIGYLVMGGDFKTIAETIPNLASRAEFLAGAFNTPFTVEGAIANPEQFTESVSAGLSNASAKDRYQVALDFGKLTNSSDIAAKMSSDPKAVNSWTQGTLTSLSALKSLTSDELGAWVTTQDYEAVFSPTFFTNLAGLEAANPEAAALVKVEALEALNGQGTRLEAMLTGMTDGPFTWDRTAGTFRLNPNPTEAMRNMGPEGGAMMDSVIRTVYGGDINALIKDKGAKLRRVAMTPDMQNETATGLRPGFSVERQRMGVLSKFMDSYFRQTEPANASKYAEAHRKNQEVTDRLYATAADQAGVPNQTHTEDVEGTVGGTTRPQNVMNASGSMTQRMMDKYEGGGDYDTLFGHSQNGGPFAGTKITNMTLSEVLDFASPRGEYGQWVKGQVGRVATPMGRFQFVGTTLRKVATEMGLDLDNTVFTPEVQNAMFQHYAMSRIGNKSGAAARKTMREGWEGFKNVSDADLDIVIEEIKSGNANFGPASSSGSRFGGGMGLQTDRIEDLLPNARGLALEDQERGLATQVPGATPVAVGEAPEASSEVLLDSVNVNGGGSGESESASASAASAEDAAFAIQSQRILRNLGLDDSTPVFRSWADMDQADIPAGTTVVVAGRKVQVQ